MRTSQRSGKWQRASAMLRCPICRRTDWCSASCDGAVAICMRETIEAVARTGNGGYLHRLRLTATPPRGASIVRHIPLHMPELELVARQAYGCGAAPLRKLATQLGLDEGNLRRLGAGLDVRRRAWTFPMWDAHGAITGIRVRSLNGRQFAVRGKLSTGGQALDDPAVTDAAARLRACVERVVAMPTEVAR